MQAHHICRPFLLGLFAFAAVSFWSSAGQPVHAAEELPFGTLQAIELLQQRDFGRLEERLTGGEEIWGRYSYLFDYSDPAIEAELNAWVAANAQSALPYLARATYYQHIGYLRRGSKFKGATNPLQVEEMLHYNNLATEDYQRALQINPKIGPAYAALMEIATSRGDDRAAEQLRRAGLAQVPDSQTIHAINLWRLHPRWGGSYQELADYIASLRARFPDHSSFKFLNGYANTIAAEQFLNARDYERALLNLNRAISSHSNSYRLRMRARALNALQRYDEAMADIAQAIEFGPDEAKSYLVRSDIHMRRKDYSKSLADLDRAVRLDPYDPEHLLRRDRTIKYLMAKEQEMGQTDLGQERVQQKREALKKALVHGKYNADVHVALGNHYLHVEQQPQPAADSYRQAIDLWPSNPAYWEQYAMALSMAPDCKALAASQTYERLCIEKRGCDVNTFVTDQIPRNLQWCEAPTAERVPELPESPWANQHPFMAACSQFFNSESAEDILKSCRELAESGDAGAQFDVGILYFFGGGGEADHEKAVKWLTKAAEQGHADAQATLAEMYREGLGVSKDMDKAMRLMQSGADGGSLQALLSLGIAYYHGDGIEQDRVKSEDLFRKAVDLGSPQARQALIELFDYEADGPTGAKPRKRPSQAEVPS